MGSLHSATLRGFLAPDPRNTCADIDDTLTSMTQAGPRPGSPVARDPESKVRFSLSGGQNSNTVNVAFVGAGFPGNDPDTSCRAAWKLEGEAASEWRGWSPPSFLHTADMLTGFNSTQNWGNHDIVTIPSTQKIIATASRKGGPAATGPESHTLDPAIWAWTDNGDVRALTATISARDHCMVVLPNETVLLIEFTTEPTPAVMDIWTAYESTDSGANWTVYANNVLPQSTASFAFNANSRLASCMVGKNVLMVRGADSGTQEFDQWASSSLGTRFTRVGSRWNAADAPQMMSLKALPNGRAGFCYWDGTDILFKSLGSAFQSLQGAPAITVAAAVTPDAVAFWPDVTGTLWVMFNVGGSNQVYVSFDDGSTWTSASALAAYRAPWNSGDATMKLLSSAASTSMGRTIVLGQGRDGGGGTTYDGMVWAVQYGGWSNVEGLGMYDEGTSLGTSWLPIQLPGSSAQWTSSGTGPVEILEAPGRMLIATTGNTRLNTHAAVWGTTKHDMLGLMDLDVLSGGSTTITRIGINGAQGDGVNRSLFEINHTTTQYSVENGGVARGTVTHNASRPQVLWYFNAADDTFSTWWRDANTAGNFTKGHDAVAITTAASASAGSFLWGHINASSSSSRWYGHHILWSTSKGSLAPSDAQADLIGKVLSALPSPVNEVGTSAAAAFLSALAGPAKRLELWDIAASHDFARDRSCWDFNPSPSEPWRSAGTDPLVSIPEQITHVWDRSQLTLLGEGSIGLALLNTNVQTAVLEGDAGAGYVTIGTFDASMSFTYTRTGDVVTAAVGTAVARYLWRGELDGAWIDLGNSKFRKIRLQTEGMLDGNITTRQVRLFLDGIVGTEPANGTATIYPHSGVLVVHNVAHYSKFRLRIPGGNSADGYWKIGVAPLGGLVVAGKQWSRGWSWESPPNAQTITDRKGTTYTEELGTAPRRFTAAWSDGVGHSGQIGGDPDYLSADTGDPLAARDDVGWWLMGLMRQWQSGKIPVVCLQSIPKVSNVTISDPRKFLFARIESSVGLDNIGGDEDSTGGRSERHRPPSVTFGEVV